MLEYTLKTLANEEVVISIDLLDNQFVKEWKKYLRTVMSRVSKWHAVVCANNRRYKTDADILENLTKLKESYSFFITHYMGDFSAEIIEIDKLIETPSNITQDHLNRWHRHFTGLEMKYCQSDYRTTTNADPELVKEAIHNVNRYVHVSEGATYYKTPRRIALGETIQYAIQFTNANHYGDDKDNVWAIVAPLSDGIYDWRTDAGDYTVWMNEDILGKDQMKAWLDHDPLSYYDVTGNLFMTPSIMLDPNKMFYKVLIDKEFQEESIASGKTVDRPPLGNIVNINIDWESILGASVTRIKLDNDIIWEDNGTLL